MRILVLGLPGAGKTTFAKHLAQLTRRPHIEVDKLFWRQDGSAVSRDALRSSVESHLEHPRWILEGHFTKIGDVVLPHTDLILFLDYSLPRILWRFLRRSKGHGTLVWLLRNVRQSRHAFRHALRSTAAPALHFRHPAQAQRFIHILQRAGDVHPSHVTNTENPERTALAVIPLVEKLLLSRRTPTGK